MKELKKTILVIDDEKSIRDSTKELLELLEYDVLTACNGKEGILLAKKKLPDVIVCDIMMPEMDGFSVLSTLLKSIDTAVIPFIFLTAKADITDLRKGMESGADDYLFKPFTADDLVKAIDARLKKQEVIYAKMEEIKGDKGKRKSYDRESRLLLMSGTHPEPIKLSSIVYIEALEHYCNVYLVENRKLLIRRAMREWEEMLPEDVFLRVHRSVIINLDYVEKFEKWFNSSYRVYLKNKTSPIEVSRRYASKIRERIRME